MSDRDRTLDELHPVSFAIGYHILGSTSEAEDAVQAALMRLDRAPDGEEQIASGSTVAAVVESSRRGRIRFYVVQAEGATVECCGR
jgi:hypothetical protein